MTRLARTASAVVALVLIGALAAPASAVSAVPGGALLAADLDCPECDPIAGGGSTWSANAINQWTRNVQANYEWRIDYADVGSTQGRNTFATENGRYDFAVSEIPYGLKDSDTENEPRPPRKFAYMPIVAGGTAFMYNLVIGGKRVTNLRLSGEVIAKIFTGVITKWDDPAIAADNPQLAMPAIPIVPVVRSDGSGTSAQFTSWMRKMHPSIWSAFCQRAGRPANCPITSSYPTNIPGFKGQSGSNGVAGYVAQPQYVGAITYVEYSYARTARFPVVKVLNAAGYYVEPTAQNVAVALLRAEINDNPSSPDYLTQRLDNVYTSSDPRAYPLSSYSYMLIPTALEYYFTPNKGLTLARFANWFLCQGQNSAADLGYSPLPINLVEAGLAQVRKIPGGEVQSISIQSCKNPTFSPDGGNRLAETAPMPQACDKQGPTQCATGTGGAQDTPTAPSGGGGAGGGSGTGGGTGAGDGTGTGEDTGGLDPLGGGATDGGLVAGGSSNLPLTVAGTPLTLPEGGIGQAPGLIAAIAAAAVVLIAVLGPPLFARRPVSARRRGAARAVGGMPGRPPRRLLPSVHLPSGRRSRVPDSAGTEGS